MMAKMRVGRPSIRKRRRQGGRGGEGVLVMA